MKLRIELLSDLCSGSGDVYNSAVDVDVVYDDYGFPFIPAKRLKGCLREACLELTEFEVVGKEAYEALFGREGKQASRFFLDNAFPENYEAMVADIRRMGDPILTHPQRVLGLYTYTRTQTAMTPDGTASGNSLRTVRVIKRGLVFEAALSLNGEEKGNASKETELLRKAAGLVRHIGTGRTRGLGLVKLTVTEEKGEKGGQDPKPEQRFTEGRYRIDYSVRLLSPVLFKSPQGDQSKSQRYIEGGKVLGLLAGRMGPEEYAELTKTPVIVSDAFPAREVRTSSGWELRRSTPVRASLQKKKDQICEENRMQVLDMLLVEGTLNEQMTPVGDLFADREGYVTDVETEISYHHRRPSDKAVGRADGNGESAFYQLESLRKGQIFAGYILADAPWAERICHVLSENRNARMGQGRTAEYGAVQITVEAVNPVEPEIADGQRVHDFVVKLNAPVILYNEFAMVSAEPRVLRDHVAELVGEPELKLEKTFLRFETVGGFNVTWNRRKPVLTVLGRGSVCLFHSEKGVRLGGLKNCFLGERVSEGYGECEVQELREQTVFLQRQETHTAAGCEGVDGGTAGSLGENAGGVNAGSHRPESQGTAEQIYETDIAQMLYREQERLRIEADARRDALALKDKRNRETDAVLGKMLLLMRTEDTVQAMKAGLEGTEAEAKRRLALELFRPVEEYVAAGSRAFSQREVFRIYGRAYLNQLKYQFRPGREERRKQHG